MPSEPLRELLDLIDRAWGGWVRPSDDAGILRAVADWMDRLDDWADSLAGRPAVERTMQNDLRRIADSHSGVPVEGLREAERFAAEAILNRVNADPDDDAAIVARAALRLAAAPREASEPLLALAQSWETAAQRMGERALVGDPSAVIASVRVLEGCAAQLRAALAPREAKTPGELAQSYSSADERTG